MSQELSSEQIDYLVDSVVAETIKLAEEIYIQHKCSPGEAFDAAEAFRMYAADWADAYREELEQRLENYPYEPGKPVNVWRYPEELDEAAQATEE